MAQLACILPCGGLRPIGFSFICFRYATKSTIKPSAVPKNQTIGLVVRRSLAKTTNQINDLTDSKQRQRQVCKGECKTICQIHAPCLFVVQLKAKRGFCTLWVAVSARPRGHAPVWWFRYRHKIARRVVVCAGAVVAGGHESAFVTSPAMRSPCFVTVAKRQSLLHGNAHPRI